MTRLRCFRLLPIGRVLISAAGKLFDEAGHLTDEETRERVRVFVEGFAAFVDQQRRRNA